MGRSISLWTMAVREGPGILARGSASKASWQDFPACKYSLELEISFSRNNLESTFYMARGTRSCWSCWWCCATSFPAALLQLCCMSSSVTTCSPLWGKLLINLSLMLFLWVFFCFVYFILCANSFLRSYPRGNKNCSTNIWIGFWRNA